MEDSRQYMGDARGGSSTVSGGGKFGNDLYRETTGNRGTVGGFANQYSKCVQGRRNMRGVEAGGRLGGSKRQQRRNSGKPCPESHRRQRGGGYRERE